MEYWIVTLSIQDELHEFTSAIQLDRGEVIPLLREGTLVNSLVVTCREPDGGELPSLDTMYLNGLRALYQKMLN